MTAEVDLELSRNSAITGNVQPLKDLVARIVDGSHNPPPKIAVGRKMLSARNIENGRIRLDDYRFISEADFQIENARTNVQAGDVLLTIVGSIGRSAVVPAGVEPFALQRSVAVLKPLRVSSKYLMYHLQAPGVQKYFNEKARGTAQKGVYLGTLGETPIRLVGPNQQERIVAEIEKQFSRLDEAVAGLERVKAKLARYKAAVLKAAVEGRLVETEAAISRREGRDYESGSQLLDRILEVQRRAWKGKGKYKERAGLAAKSQPRVPAGWVVCSIDQIANVVRGASPRPAGDPRFFGGSIPWITVGPLTADESPYLHAVKDGLTNEGRECSRSIGAGTLLLTNSGATLGVPKITLINGCINDGVVALQGVDDPLKLYLLYFLRTQTAALRRINQGAAQPNLNTSIVKAIRVPLPPTNEQHRIVAEVDRRLSLVRGLEAQVEANLKRAERLRQTILARAFSGRLVPSAATKRESAEPATAGA